jgi:hypothetical protein
MSPERAMGVGPFLPWLKPRGLSGPCSLIRNLSRGRPYLYANGSRWAAGGTASENVI